MPRKIDRFALGAAAGRATANHTVPTGFSSVPPPGPAMPVTETAMSTPSRCSAPSAIARATASLTAPCRLDQLRRTPSSAILSALE